MNQPFRFYSLRWPFNSQFNGHTHLCPAIIRNARQYIEDAGVGVLCQHQAGGRLHGGRLWGAGGGLPVIGRESQCIAFKSNKLVQFYIGIF